MKNRIKLLIASAALVFISASVLADNYEAVPGTSTVDVWDTTNGSLYSIGIAGQSTVTVIPNAATANTWSGINNFTGTFEIGGTTETFPASGLIVGTTDSQTLSSKTLSSPTVTGSLTISTGATGTSINTAQTSVPTVTSCGGGSPVVTGTDTDGLITTGSGSPTTCDLVFNTPKSVVPHCTANVTSGVGVVTVLGTTTTAQVNLSLSATATGIQYICLE